MTELVSFIPFGIPPKNTWTTFDVLLVALISAFTLWYGQYHWKRRKLYYYASKVDGPLWVPFLGSAYLFICHLNQIFDNIMWLFNTYPKGAAVWLGQKLFFTLNTPDQFDILFNSPKALAKEELYKHAVPTVGWSLFTSDVKTWKRHKKVIMPTFNQKILDQFVLVFGEQAEILTEQLKKYSGKKNMDISVIANCTLDTICETAMGVKVHAQTQHSEFGEWCDKVMIITFLRMFVLLYQFDFIFNLTHWKTDQDFLTSSIHNFTDKVIQERKKQYEQKMEDIRSGRIALIDPTERKTFLDCMLETAEADKFNNIELRDEVVTFTIAGTDTTSSSISFILLALGMHQDVQQKVYEEVVDVLGPDRVVECDDLPNLKYTERVIKESLRLFPVGAFVVRHVEEDLDVGDFVIPGGASAIMGFLNCHRNPKYWPDPLKFDPDRFLPEEVAKRHPYCYAPFSLGPRNCVGHKYAMMLMKCIISMVVRRHKFFTDYENVESVALKAHVVVRPRDGFKIRVEARE